MQEAKKCPPSIHDEPWPHSKCMLILQYSDRQTVTVSIEPLSHINNYDSMNYNIKLILLFVGQLFSYLGPLQILITLFRRPIVQVIRATTTFY